MEWKTVLLRKNYLVSFNAALHGLLCDGFVMENIFYLRRIPTSIGPRSHNVNSRRYWVVVNFGKLFENVRNRNDSVICDLQNCVFIINCELDNHKICNQNLQ